MKTINTNKLVSFSKQLILLNNALELHDVIVHRIKYLPNIYYVKLIKQGELIFNILSYSLCYSC